MKIIVAGCGKIGTAILESLVAEGHDVVAIDDNADVITEITNIYDVMGVCGNRPLTRRASNPHSFLSPRRVPTK